MSRPRVMIADDHPILAEGLRTVLEGEFDIVGVVSDGRELVSEAQTLRPEVIITDISMPTLSGIDAVTELRDLGVESKVVFLTQHNDVAYARRAMEAGAVGYVLKHSVTAELITALREALRGRTYVTPMIAGELFRSYSDGAHRTDDPGDRLTGRQREVLQLFAEGRSAKEVASALKISVRTAEAHKAHILEILGLETTADLVRYAIRKGIISP